LLLQRILRFKKHTLGKKEEELLAMQGEMAQAASRAFRQLHDADLKFGFVKNDKGEQVELSNATFLQLLHSPLREVRRTTFEQYYEQFQAHENTLAATLNGSVQADIYYARLAVTRAPVRRPCSRIRCRRRSTITWSTPCAGACLPCIAIITATPQDASEREIHHYDTYVPILTGQQQQRTWAQAVDAVVAALAPLGDEYVSVLKQGLTGRWCDRYPNRASRAARSVVGRSMVIRTS